jgi:hypothetical protein
MNSLNVNTFEDFKNLEMDDRRKVLSEELSNQSIKTLAEKWDCKEGNLYDMRRNLGLPTSKGNISPPKTPYAKKIINKEPNYMPVTAEKEITKKMANNNILEPDSFTIRLCCKTKGEEISDRLMRIVDILSKDSNYQLTFDIKEIKTEPQPEKEAEEPESGNNGEN